MEIVVFIIKDNKAKESRSALVGIVMFTDVLPRSLTLSPKLQRQATTMKHIYRNMWDMKAQNKIYNKDVVVVNVEMLHIRSLSQFNMKLNLPKMHVLLF